MGVYGNGKDMESLGVGRILLMRFSFLYVLMYGIEVLIFIIRVH